MVSFERQLAASWAMRVSGIQSWAKNQWRVNNVLRPYSAYNIPITNPDPGNDGVVGNADDPAGVTFTYWDYPAAVRGIREPGFRVRQRQVSRIGRYTLLRVRAEPAVWEQLAVPGVLQRHSEDRAVRHLRQRPRLPGWIPTQRSMPPTTGSWSGQFRAAASYLFKYGILSVCEFRPTQRRVLGAQRAVSRSGRQPHPDVRDEGRAARQPAGRRPQHAGSPSGEAVRSRQRAPSGR